MKTKHIETYANSPSGRQQMGAAPLPAKEPGVHVEMSYLEGAVGALEQSAGHLIERIASVAIASPVREGASATGAPEETRSGVGEQIRMLRRRVEGIVSRLDVARNELDI